MDWSEINMGFPDVEGYMMHTCIECNSQPSIMLWFHSPSGNLSEMINVQVYLFNARMREANVALTPFLPPMKSYTVKDAAEDTGMKILNVCFETGEMSFRFEKACYVKSKHALGQIPEELELKLGLK